MHNEIKQSFVEWLKDEHYRVAQAYRVSLAKEIDGTYRVMRRINIAEYKHLLIASLKQIQPPPYKSCPILLERDIMTELYDSTPKPDFKTILKNYIDDL
jgi:hypothetical protein